MRKLVYVVALLSALVFASCRGGKDVVVQPPKITMSGTAREAASAVINSYSSWSTLQTGGSVTIGGGGHDFSSGMQLRMVRDSMIVISLRPLLGIEMGKMILARDSVLIIDKWHKQYLLEPVNVITSGIDVTIGNLQDIFLGRPFKVGGSTLTETDKWTAMLDDRLTITPSHDAEQVYSYTFTYGDDSHIKSLAVTPHGDAVGSYAVEYDDVEDTSSGAVPRHMNAVATVQRAPLKLELDINNIRWDKDVKRETFVAPRGYKRISIKSLMSLFGD